MENSLRARTMVEMTDNSTGVYSLDLSRAVPVSILLALIDIITIFGNILVIIAVLITPTLKSATTSYYIISLAISDLMVGILILPFSSVYEILDYWVFSSVFCVIWLSTDVMTCTASILNLLCISIDRYLAISRPLYYHKYSSPKFVYLMIGAAWFLAFLISVAPIFGFDRSSEDGHQCKVSASTLFWALYSSVGSFFLPLTIMLILYWRIYLVASKHSKFMREERERFASLAQQLHGFDETRGRNLSLESNEPNEIKLDHRVSRVTIQSSETPQAEYHGLPKDSIPNAKKIGFSKKLRRMSKDKKAAKTLFIVMACFVGCWFPFFTVYFIDGVCKEICNIPSWVFKSFFWLGYCNSMLNPAIYAASSQDFRMAFRRILRCSFGRPYNRDPFGQGDAERSHFQSSRQAGNGGPGSMAVPQRQSVASHIISKGRNNAHELDSPASNRLTPVGQIYVRVEQRENGLGPIINSKWQVGEEEPYSSTQKVPDLLLEDASEVPTNTSSSSTKGTRNHGHKLLTNKASLPIYPINAASRSRRLSSVGEYQSQELDQAQRRTKEGRMKNSTSYLSDLKEETIDFRGSNMIQVSDAGVSTCDPERVEIGVQTSISFVNLGSI